MTHANDTIRVLIPLKVRKKNGRPKNPAARRLSAERGPDAGPACFARHRPGMGLAAADGGRRVQHDPGTGRGRRAG